MWRDDSSLTVRAYPLAIGQLASGGIPSGTFTFEFSRDLVEGERLRLENSACECDFLYFHFFGVLWRERLSEPIEPLQGGAEESEGE